jgi:hypothetical protein
MSTLSRNGVIPADRKLLTSKTRFSRILASQNETFYSPVRGVDRILHVPWPPELPKFISLVSENPYSQKKRLH